MFPKKAVTAAQLLCNFDDLHIKHLGITSRGDIYIYVIQW